jgi:hypothetical protein
VLMTQKLQKLFKENTILDVKNSVSDKIYFYVTSGPLIHQVITYTNIRYDKVNDILYYDYSFQREIEIPDGFDFHEYLSTLLKMHLAFKDLLL